MFLQSVSMMRPELKEELFLFTLHGNETGTGTGSGPRQEEESGSIAVYKIVKCGMYG